MAVAITNEVSLVFIVIFVIAAAATAARVTREDYNLNMRKQLKSPSNSTSPFASTGSLRHVRRPSSDAINVTSEEYLELRRQLKSLNKPAVKSIKTAHGDILDCVDIYKQPALDHPLLKDHKIQMWPTSFPKRSEGMKNSSASGMEIRVELPDGGCPQGTVPIRRTRMQDLLRIKSLPKLKNKAINENVRDNHHWVSVQTPGGGPYYGARADMNVWNPWVGNEKQLSLEQFWIVGGDYDDVINTVEAGWMVYPHIFGDNHTRLFVYWTADGYQQTGCYNTFCPGFVQVSRDVIPGSPIVPISIYDGNQYHIVLQAFQDAETQNWWVTLGYDQKPLGYFPKSIFNNLADGSKRIMWGGEVYTAGLAEEPQMGSGHFSNEGYGKAAFMKMVMTVDHKRTLRDAPINTEALQDQPKCYNVDRSDQYGDQKWRRFFFFGGPGCN